MSSDCDLHPVPFTNGYHDLLTEQELIDFLRIPEVTTAQDYSNVIENLVKMHDLPRIKLCHKRLYPRKAVLQWIEKQTIR